MTFSSYEKAQLKEFFKDIYGEVAKLFKKQYPELYIEIRGINQEGHIKREFFPIHVLGFEKAIEEAINYAESINKEKYNAYYGIALRKAKKGSKEDSIPYVAFVPLDLDVLKDHLNLSKEELKELSEKEAKEKVLKYWYEVIRPRFEEFNMIPSWVLYTGHGIQALWLVNGFVTEEELQEAKTYIVPSMKGDPKIYEGARILRVPFSINWKIEEHPKKGEVLERTNEIYSFNELLESLKEYYKAYAPREEVRNTKVAQVDLSELRKRFSQTKSPPCIEVALNGVKKGLRNQTAYFLASYFAQVGWKYQDIESYLVNEWNPRNDPPIGDQGDDDKINSLLATIKSAYEDVTGKKVKKVKEGDKEVIIEEEGEPKAQKFSGCSWARSNGLCPFKTMVECPIGRRALANKLRQIAKEMDNTPRTLEDFREFIRTFPGSGRWAHEVIAFLEEKGFQEVTKLDLMNILKELNPPRKKLDKSPREAKKKEAPSREIRSLDDLKDEEKKIVIRHYIMEGIKLDTNKAPFNSLELPYVFLKEVKRGRKTVLEANKPLLEKFANFIGLDSVDSMISGWDLVEKIKEAFNVPDEELQELILEAIKDMLGTPNMRVFPCIEAIVDKLAEGEPIGQEELKVLVSFIKYYSQGKRRAREKIGYDPKFGLWKFMVEMLPGFEGNMGQWLTEFLKIYEDIEPFKCPLIQDKPNLAKLCNLDNCPKENPRDNLEGILAHIEEAYIIDNEKLSFAIGGKVETIDYDPLLDTIKPLREFKRKVEGVYRASLGLERDHIKEILEDLRLRAIWKSFHMEPKDIVEEVLAKYFLEELENGVTKYPTLVEGYLAYDPKTKTIYVPIKSMLLSVVNRAFERYGVASLRDPRELTYILNGLKGFFLKSTKKSKPIYNTKHEVVSTTTIWKFSLTYLERRVGRKINVKFLKPEEIFFQAEDSQEEGENESTAITIEEIMGEILEMLRKEPKSDWEIVEELKKKYPKEMVETALEELFMEGKIAYDESIDKLKVKEG